jgi:integrase
MATVRKRKWGPDGKEKTAWVVNYKDQQGKRHQKTFVLRGEAKDWLARTLGEVQAGTHTPDRSTITFLQAGELWLERQVLECAESTAQGCRYRFNKYLRPSALADVKLSQLKEQMITDFFKKIAEEVSLKHAHTMYGEIKEIVGLAKKRRLCNQGVVDVVEACKPNRLHKRKKLVGVDIPSKRDVQLILDNAPKGWKRDLFVTAAFTGMRPGELRALHWEDVDFEEKVIRVSRTLWLRKFKKPKSEAGVRQIPMSPIVYNTLWRRAYPPPNEPSEASLRHLERCIAEGELLLKARDEVKHGEWLAWLAANTDRPSRTSRLYMQLARDKASLPQSNIVELPTPKQKPTGLVFLTDRAPRQMLGTSAIDAAFARLQLKIGMVNTDPTRVLDHAGNATRQARAEFDRSVMPIIREIQASGVTSALGIARKLDQRGVLTSTGYRGWGYGSVQDMLERAAGRQARYDAHSLRHFAASLFIESGFSAKWVQEILGHSSIRVTMDVYAHLFETHEHDQKKLAEAEASVLTTSRDKA